MRDRAASTAPRGRELPPDGNVHDDDDAPLVARAINGDRDALDGLLTRHADRVHAICRRIVNDPQDALDATQEALLAIARGIARFDGRSRFTTWLHRVATNAALDELRRARRRPLPSDPVALPDAAERGAVGRVADPAIARVDVDAALAQLPDEFRVAVVLRDLVDLDYAEIAEVLEIPPGTVRSRISRGRALLHDLLDPDAGNPGGPTERRSDDG